MNVGSVLSMKVRLINPEHIFQIYAYDYLQDARIQWTNIYLSSKHRFIIHNKTSVTRTIFGTMERVRDMSSSRVSHGT